MTLPVLLLDCDGPLANFTDAYLRAVDAVAAEIGSTTESKAPREAWYSIRRVEVSDVDRWSIHECPFFVETAEKLELTPAGLRRRVDERVTDEGFCRNIAVQPGAHDAVMALAELADIYVVTSPWHSSPTWAHERTAWLWDHFQIPAKRVIHTHSKARVHGDLLLDDNAGHCRDWSKQWPNGTAILHALPSNANDGEGLMRGGWADVIAEVKKRGVVAA